MIYSKKSIQEVLPADVTGRSVAHPKRWLVALVRVSHEKKTSERLSKMGMDDAWTFLVAVFVDIVHIELFSKKCINGVIVER